MNVNVHMDYYPPGYFRVFGDFLAAKLGGTAQAANGQTHHDFWYKTAETVYEMLERCYDQAGLQHGLCRLLGQFIRLLLAPKWEVQSGPYEWERFLWRVGIDAAWFGNNTSLPEVAPNSSKHYQAQVRMQAEIDNIQAYFNNFYKNNPVEANANRFSSICDSLSPRWHRHELRSCQWPQLLYRQHRPCARMSAVQRWRGHDLGHPARGHRRVLCPRPWKTTSTSRNPFGVYSMLFLTGNFPNPMTVPPLK
jgi:hypothetical protein